MLDGWYKDESGLRLIAEASARGVPAMLISNFGDAQTAARASGALPGFGKAEARSDKATRAILAALAMERDPHADA